MTWFCFLGKTWAYTLVPLIVLDYLGFKFLLESVGKLNISINVSIYCKFSNVLMWKLYSFSRALITKYHKLGWLKQQNFVFIHPAGLKSQIKCWELISSEKFFLGSWIAFFSPCAFTWSFFVYLSVLISSSYKDTS